MTRNLLDTGPVAKEGLRRAYCDLFIENVKRLMAKQMKNTNTVLRHDNHIGPAAIQSQDPKDVGRGCADVA